MTGAASAAATTRLPPALIPGLGDRSLPRVLRNGRLYVALNRVADGEYYPFGESNPVRGSMWYYAKRGWRFEAAVWLATQAGEALRLYERHGSPWFLARQDEFRRRACEAYADFVENYRRGNWT